MHMAALFAAIGCLAALATGQNLTELQKTLALKQQTKVILVKKCTTTAAAASSDEQDEQVPHAPCRPVI